MEQVPPNAKNPCTTQNRLKINMFVITAASIYALDLKNTSPYYSIMTSSPELFPNLHSGDPLLFEDTKKYEDRLVGNHEKNRA